VFRISKLEILKTVPFYNWQIKINIILWLPAQIEHAAVALLLVYRRLRYKYVFRRIKLTKGYYAKVDPDLYESLNKYKWCVTGTGPFYAITYLKDPDKPASRAKPVSMHRLIMQSELDAIRNTRYAIRNKLPCDLVIDHLNHDGLDNRRANLRLATPLQNKWNTRHRRKGRSKYTGVTWVKTTKKWRADICIDKKVKYLGCYDSEKQAAKAYDKTAKKHRGEYAVLNFP